MSVWLISLSALVAQIVRGSCLGFSIPCVGIVGALDPDQAMQVCSVIGALPIAEAGSMKFWYVFPGRDGAPSYPGSLRCRVHAPAAKRAGLSGVGFHTLRHTGASMLIEAGCPRCGFSAGWVTTPPRSGSRCTALLDGDLGPPARHPPRTREAGEGSRDPVGMPRRRKAGGRYAVPYLATSRSSRRHGIAMWTRNGQARRAGIGSDS
jgi:hypothetical protein